MGRTSLLDKEAGSFFNQVVRDAYKDLSSGRTAYVFSSEQVDAILELIKKSKCSFTQDDISIREDDGFYYLTNTKGKMKGIKNEK